MMFTGAEAQRAAGQAPATCSSDIIGPNFENQFLERFKAPLAPMQYQNFATLFNKGKRLLQIEEDNAPFSEANHHSCVDATSNHYVSVLQSLH